MSTKQLVVGFDGSESSRLALTWAMQDARTRGLPVLLAHALYSAVGPVEGFVTSAEAGPEALLVAAHEMVTAAEHEARREVPGVELSSRIVTGPPVQALLGLLGSAELLVVGSRGLGSFKELLLGSTSLELAAGASCPVVVVRSTGYTEPGPQAGRVVVGVDGSTGSARALALAFEEASLRGIGLSAVCAWQVPNYEAYGWASSVTDQSMVSVYEREAHRSLSESLAGWQEKYPDVDVRPVLVRSEPVAALVNASLGAEAVVLGSRGLGGFRSLLLGSVTHGVLHHARCAVAVVPPTTE
jgi:nucleotide-binding universal stress UspA family protein